jgi:dTMP kinase
MQQKALFISFEGCEGSGKSTQSKSLYNWLLSKNLKVLLTREPGGTDSAEAIRQILLNKHMKFDDISQLLLHFVARNEHVNDVIKPHLEQNYIVICDRYIDSTVAYQGYGGGISLDLIKDLHKTIINDLNPDVTFVLDVSLEQCIRRIQKKQNIDDRYENLGQEFHEKVAGGFLGIAKQNQERCVLLDASRSIEATELAIQTKITSLLSTQ